MLARVSLPPSVRHHAHLRAWQRKFYDMNIWNPKKRHEKLNYMQNNPVIEAWSSTRATGRGPAAAGRFYFWNDGSILGMHKML